MLFAIGAHATETDDLAFAQKWIATPLAQATTADGKIIEAKILQRMVYADPQTAFVAGNIVYVKYPRPADYDPDQVADAIRDALGIEPWAKRIYRGTRVYDGNWENSNRFVRVFMTADQENIAYSIALYRPAYADPVASESEIIQRALSKTLRTKVPLLERIVRNEWRNELRRQRQGLAWATGGTPAAPGTGAPAGGAAPTASCGGPCATGDMSCQLARSDCKTDQLLGALGQTNIGLNAANVQWAGTNKNWTTSNHELHRANSLLSEFMKPDKVFIAAAAGAAGAGVATLALGVATDAIVAGGKAFYNLVFEDKDKIRENFKRAREIWESTADSTAALETLLDNLIHIKKLTDSSGLNREQLIRRQAAKLERLNARTKNLEEDLQTADRDGDEACQRELSESLAQTRAEAEGAKALLEMVRKMTDNPICRQMEDSVGKLIEAERLLQNARMHLYGGRDVAVADMSREFDEAQRSYQRGLRIAKRTYNVEDAAAKRHYRKGRKDLENRKWLWLSACRVKHTPGIPIFGRIYSEIAGVRSKCNRIFEESAAGKRYTEELEDLTQGLAEGLAHALNNLEKWKIKNPPAPSTRLQNSAVREFDEFILRITDDQLDIIKKFKRIRAKQEKAMEACGRSYIN